MRSLDRSPTKAEALLAGLLSFLATAIFGAVAAFLWLGPTVSSLISKIIFTAFFLVSAALLIRVAITARRALSQPEARLLAWAFTVAGIGAVVAGLLFTSDWSRGSLLASGFSCLAYGFAGLSHNRR